MDLFTRSPKNPILKPEENHDWESLKVYNPGAIYDNGEYHLFYRARGRDWVSRIGYAWSLDGENFTRQAISLIDIRDNTETKGVEDPRMVKIGDTFYLTCTAYDGVTARLSLLTSPDMKRWKRHGV